jgi:hypothetical protein
MPHSTGLVDTVFTVAVVSRILTVAARLASKQAQTAAVKEGGFPQNNISKSEHISVLIDAARRLLYRNAA